MPWLSDPQRRLIEAISDVGYSNPFLPDRLAAERRTLGDAFVDPGPAWSLEPDDLTDRPNVVRINERVTELADDLRAQLAQRSPTVRPSAREVELYADLVLYLLYHRYNVRLHDLAEQASAGGQTGSTRVRFWRAFRKEFAHYLEVPGLGGRPHDPGHVLACFFQIRRAFFHIFAFIVGRSSAATRLRASVWQSIFTHDLRRHYHGLFSRMPDFTTLITGASGTGKELVARAVAMSCYIPFDAKAERFAQGLADSFVALNLSAMPITLIESELFGHKRGSFTGAVSDRAGWLETCPPHGTVFLDEIGELEPAIQVKLLRVLQARTFSRTGDTQVRPFRGKIIAATNRDLAAEMQAGRFRTDLFYRLCSDVITTPSLREQLDDGPDELALLVRFIAQRLVGDGGAAVAQQVQRWVHDHLPRHAWPGNFRELEQCVRNVIVRGAYHPPTNTPPAGDVLEELLGHLRAGSLTADAMVGRYCTLVYARTGSYLATAQQLAIDRRTVRSKIDLQWLARLSPAHKGD